MISIAPNRRWLLLLGGLAFIGLATLPWTYPKAKAWRVSRLVHHAEVAIANQKPSEAFSYAQAALQLQPENASALRTMAKLLSVGPPSQAIPVWRALLANASALPRDRIEWVSYTARIGRPDLSGRQVGEILRQQPIPTQAIIAAAQWHQAAGGKEHALRLGLEALRRTPDDTALLLLICRIQRDSNSAKERQQAAQILASIAGQPTDAGLEAIEMLSSFAELPFDSITNILRALKVHPRRTPRHRVIEAELALRLDQTRSPFVIGELVQAANQEPTIKADVARWFNRHQFFQQTESLFIAGAGQKDRELVLAYLDALAAQKQWTQIREHLAKPGIALEPVLVELFRFRCALELKEDRSIPLRFEQALTAAKNDPAKLWFLFQYLEKLGLNAYARSILQSLRKVVEDPRPVLLAHLRLAEREDDLEKLLSIMKEMAELHPSDLEPQNDLAYLKLLARRDVHASLEIAERLVATNPDWLAFRTTLALAYLRTKPQAAAAVYRGLKVEWSKVPPAWKAIHAASIAASGSLEEARKVVLGIPTSLLRKEELALIRSLL